MRLTEEEKADYKRDGFVIRRGVFEEHELEEMRRAGDEVIEQLIAIRHGQRLPAGSYTFELEATTDVVIKWEGDSDVVQGIEPFAHFHPTFERYGLDERFLEPARDILGVEDIGLFTEKLNYKRARHGGKVALHQDYPYWVGTVDDLDRIMTTMLLLDDSTVENGCLYVVPGSHEWGVQPGKDVADFGKFEMDDDAFDLSLLVPVELAAGDMVMFGPLMIHRSQPNPSDKDRRALLYTYQPAGNRHTLDSLRKLSAAVRAAEAR
jgi:hypothetical protein